MQQVNLRVPKELLERFDKLIPDFYPNRNEALRYAMRTLIREHKKFTIDYPTKIRQS